jgi:hypothetical protein
VTGVTGVTTLSLSVFAETIEIADGVTSIEGTRDRCDSGRKNLGASVAQTNLLIDGLSRQRYEEDMEHFHWANEEGLRPVAYLNAIYRTVFQICEVHRP